MLRKNHLEDETSGSRRHKELEEAEKEEGENLPLFRKLDNMMKNN